MMFWVMRFHLTTLLWWACCKHELLAFANGFVEETTSTSGTDECAKSDLDYESDILIPTLSLDSDWDSDEMLSELSYIMEEIGLFYLEMPEIDHTLYNNAINEARLFHKSIINYEFKQKFGYNYNYTYNQLYYDKLIGFLQDNFKVCESRF